MYNMAFHLIVYKEFLSIMNVNKNSNFLVPFIYVSKTYFQTIIMFLKTEELKLQTTS